MAVATACSSSAEPKTIRVTVTQTVTASPSPQDARAAAGGVLKMGSKKNITEVENDLHITVQAVEYQQPYKGPQPEKPQDFQGGDIWATANVKVCNVQGTDVEVSQFPWSLAYEDGTSIEVTGSSGGDMPKPEFPMGKTVKPGRCAAGLIAFPVPSDRRPERLVYEPEDGDVTEWAVG
ncbi:DUF4352 domain-containing protein [Streptomyces salinarius]|uniref:DUF4352 domain-containing protein n=1 Tax=Streptomyces salinarius TaxID=2762598 RepID=UPI001F09159A|nr:DUF4352 domain-containing protein [Streptomyces salinarius]